MLCLSLKSWSVFGKLSPAVCSMERRSKVHTWELPRDPQEWEHAQAEDSWDQGFGIVHHLLTCKKHCSVVFLSILELLTYPKTCFNLSSSKLLSSVDNKEPREEKGKLHPSDVWAIITEIEACVLFLCLYWWSQVKGLMIFFFLVENNPHMKRTAQSSARFWQLLCSESDSKYMRPCQPPYMWSVLLLGDSALEV